MKILFSQLTILTLAFSPMNAEMRIILTAALTDNCFEFRKNQYIESLSILAKYGYKNPYIVEAIRTPGPTFLDDYSTNVFYATCNNPSIRNLGANEARTLLEALEYFQFADDDMILKLTGRYQLFSDRLIKIVEKNQHKFDAFIMMPNEKKKRVLIRDAEILKANKTALANAMLTWKNKGIILKGETPVTNMLLQQIYNLMETKDEFWGMAAPEFREITHLSIYCHGIAMKCKYFKEMLRSLNYARLDHPKDWVPLEIELERYIKQKINGGSFNIFYLDKLDIWAQIYGSSTLPGNPLEVRIY
jgi:hypothetical protein